MPATSRCPVFEPLSGATRFEGDGRRRLIADEPETRVGHPAPLTRATARRLIEQFVQCGCSFHSAQCTTAWPILEYLRIRGLPHEILYGECGGVQIRLLRPSSGQVGENQAGEPSHAA